MLVSVRSSSARRARVLQDALAARGVEAVAFVGPAPRPRTAREDVAILDAHPDERAWAEAEAARLAAREDRPGAIVAATTINQPPLSDADPFDGWVQVDGPAALLTRELVSARRATTAREELERRLITARATGVAPTFLAPAGGWRVLYIGEPHPFFLTLERALAARDGRLEAAFSSFMGFDFLHDGRFDAVALNAGSDSATALALCGALRRNARLHHLPTTMLAEENAAEISVSAIERGASLIVSADTDHDTAIAWMFEKIRRGRREAYVEAGLTAVREASGGATSLFSAAFFDAHIERLAHAAHMSGQPLSLAALRVQLAPGARRASAAGWRRGLHQVAEIAGRLIRVEDTAALLDGDMIVIALPSTLTSEALRTSERVASVTECTAFAAGETDAGPIVLGRNVTELVAGESGRAFLSRTLSVFDLEGARA